MAHTRRQVLDQLRTLREEFDALRDEVETLGRGNGHAAARPLLQAASRVGERLTSLSSLAKDRAHDAGRRAGTMITTHPVLALAGALAIGAVAASLLSQRNRRRDSRWRPFRRY